MSRAWAADAVGAIEADFARSSDTHLLRFDLPELPRVRLYLKDESTHPSGSLKHRLARSLFLYGLCNGWIVEGRPVIEASSGSTAISEAYFARLLGLDFIAVLPEQTASRKIAEITRQGGRVHRVACATEIDRAARDLAAQLGGHFLDQFTYAERATDWRGNNNIAESLFAQMAREPHPAPDWIVVGAGTGGTSATLGRYVRYTPRLARQTRICVVDPVGSAFFPAYAEGRRDVTAPGGSVAEGVGRPRVEPSFLPEVIDRMIAVPDAAAVAATLWLERRLGRRCGPSTGVNLIGALTLAQEMADAGRAGSIATLICDPGERYADTIFDADWRRARDLDDAAWRDCFDGFERTGRFAPPAPLASAVYRG